MKKYEVKPDPETIGIMTTASKEEELIGIFEFKLVCLVLSLIILWRN